VGICTKYGDREEVLITCCEVFTKNVVLELDLEDE